MSNDQIDGLGPMKARLRPNPHADPAKLPLSNEDYFIWTRVDGHTSIQEVLMLSSFARSRTVTILRRLHRMGALLGPDETPEQAAPRLREALAHAQSLPARVSRSDTGANKAFPKPPLRPQPPVRPPISAPQQAGATQSPKRVPPRPNAAPAASATSPQASAQTSKRAPGRTAAQTAARAPGQTTAKAAERASGQTAAKAAAERAPVQTQTSERTPVQPPAQTSKPTPKPATADEPSSLQALEPLSQEEERALASEVELEIDQKIRIVTLRRKFVQADHFAVLGVESDVQAKVLKRAYFKLSKEFHPDRYYGRHTGPFEPWLTEIFQRIKSAYEVLSNRKQREAYERKLAGQRGPTSQSKTEYAAELFERACTSHLSGDLSGALVMFSGAIRLDPQPRYLSRAARCAIENEDSDTALTYARQATTQAPKDPSLQRVLAAAQVSAGQIDEARATLEAALTLKTENDALMGGIRADLERLLSQR